MEYLTSAQWRKSTRSGNDGACVEVAAVAAVRLVRDSKLGDTSPVLAVPTAAFEELLTAVRGDHFDR